MAQSLSHKLTASWRPKWFVGVQRAETAISCLLAKKGQWLRMLTSLIRRIASIKFFFLLRRNGGNEVKWKQIKIFCCFRSLIDLNLLDLTLLTEGPSHEIKLVMVRVIQSCHRMTDFFYFSVCGTCQWPTWHGAGVMRDTDHKLVCRVKVGCNSV